MSDEISREFPIPTLRRTRRRIPMERLQAVLASKGIVRDTRTLAGAPVVHVESETRLLLAEAVYENPALDQAALLMEACLAHPDRFVRVCAASSLFDLSLEPRRLLWILEQGTHSAEPLVREVAATALARVAPEHPRLLELLRGPNPVMEIEPSHTSTIIHGTFARGFDWWQTGGDFHTYLLNQVRPDIYGAADRFDWSGGYSDAARLIGGQQLLRWFTDHTLEWFGLVFAHSHGGSVAMLASQAGMRMDQLVLLSCPVHVPKYLPNFSTIGKVTSLHVRLDAVILADGGGQRYRHPRIDEHVLPVWFNHSATHHPDVWTAHNVPALL